jgi:hypothetical protein
VEFEAGAEVKLREMFLLGNAGLSARQGMVRADHDAAAQGLLRALKLAVLFTALASIPCLAEAPNKPAVGLVASMGIDHSICTPNETAVVKGGN